MKKKTKILTCFECGSELIEAEMYKLECPKDCANGAMEQWWWEDQLKEEGVENE